MKGKPSRKMKIGFLTLICISLTISVVALTATAQNMERPQPAGNLAEALAEALKGLTAGNPGPQAAEEPSDEYEYEDLDRQADESQSGELDLQVSPEGKVRMHARELSISSVLEMLSIQSQRNIIASPNVTGTVNANLYDVSFEEALTGILVSLNCGWLERGKFIYVYTLQELEDMEAAARQMVTRLFRLYYTRAADVGAMLKPLLSDKGSISLSPPAEIGVGPNAEEAGGDSLATEDCLVVTDYPENVKAIAKLIKEIDLRPKQVLIEATILRAQLNEDNALGIDFNIVGGVDFQGLASTSPSITDLITGDLPAALMQNTTFTTRTDFNDAIPGGGFTFGIVKDSIGVFIRALEQVTDTTVLANPKIHALNKQRGEVIVGRRDGYLTTTVTQTAAIQSVEFLETGTQLIFRPFIGDDGYVRMELHPKDSTGGLTAANLPFEQTTEVTTNIMVRDGHTILIGGLFREVTSASRAQVPIIGNLPVVGALFRNTRDSTQREEVIILLTVHIVKDNDLLDEASAEAAEDVERFRTGMRQGLQGHGRERLAQAHYRWALDHLAKGHSSRAMWDLDLAINNNPKFITAIRLKEKLLDQRVWDDDGSRMRTFISRQIMKEQGIITPLFGRPGPPFEFPAMRGPSGFDEDGNAGSQTKGPTETPEGSSAVSNSNEEQS